MPRAAAAVRLAEPAEEPLTLEAFLRANLRPATIDLGTCVRVPLMRGFSTSAGAEEGVVIEVVPPGKAVQTARVVDYQPGKRSGSTLARFVVQTWNRRVLRQERELEVVAR